MGNNCTCSQLSSEKRTTVNQKDDISRFLKFNMDKLETRLFDEEEDYFFRMKCSDTHRSKATSDNQESSKNNEIDTPTIGKQSRKKQKLKGSDCIINVDRILMYINQHENDFVSFLNESNVKSLNFLRYMVLNYESYLIYIHPNVIYIGELNDKKQKHGLGILITPDQCLYVGEFEKEKITGFGLFVHNSKSKYIGYWSNGKSNGYGTFLHKNGTFYIGQWLNDKQHEKGIEYVYDNYLFMGSFREGEKNGSGCFIWKNESMYIGNVKNNVFDKDGVYFFNKKKIVLGNWLDNSLEDIGETLWSDKKQFCGLYTNNLKNGLGLYKWNDGRIYFGNWIQNKQHGYGIFILIKNIRDYEHHIRNDFMIFFRNTKTIRDKFLSYLNKESIFTAGEIQASFDLIRNNSSVPEFYDFLLTLSQMNYYNVCCTFFEKSKIKNPNGFKHSCAFYNEVKSYMRYSTNLYLRGISYTGADVVEFEENTVKANEPETTTLVPNEVENEDEESFFEDLLSSSDNDTHNNDSRKISSSRKETYNNMKFPQSIQFQSKILQNHVSSSHASMKKKEKEKKFGDIEKLNKYLNSVNILKMNESDINILHPIFSLASENIIVKLGKWEHGKIMKWVYSSDQEATSFDRNNSSDFILKKIYTIIDNGEKLNSKYMSSTSEINTFLNSLSPVIMDKIPWKNYSDDIDGDIDSVNSGNNELRKDSGGICTLFKSEDNSDSNEGNDGSSIFTVADKNDVLTLHEKAQFHHSIGDYIPKIKSFKTKRESQKKIMSRSKIESLAKQKTRISFLDQSNSNYQRTSTLTGPQKNQSILVDSSKKNHNYADEIEICEKKKTRDTTLSSENSFIFQIRDKDTNKINRKKTSMKKRQSKQSESSEDMNLMKTKISSKLKLSEDEEEGEVKEDEGKLQLTACNKNEASKNHQKKSKNASETTNNINEKNNFIFNKSMRSSKSSPFDLPKRGFSKLWNFKKINFSGGLKNESLDNHEDCFLSKSESLKYKNKKQKKKFLKRWLSKGKYKIDN